jgi:amino acid transporter
MSGLAGRSELFSRQSSGLVKLGSPFRTYAFNLGFTGVTYTVFIFEYLGGMFPRANLFLSIGVAIVGFTALALVYAMLSASMPRSGGDYVYVSRTLHPVVGFAANFAFALAYVFFIAQGAYLLSSFILSSFFSTLGSITESHTLLNLGTTNFRRVVS